MIIILINIRVKVFSEKCQVKLMKSSQDLINGLMCMKQQMDNQNQNILKSKPKEEIIKENVNNYEISSAMNNSVPEDRDFMLD